MFRLHAACLAFALTGIPVRAQAPPATGKAPADDDAAVRRLLRRFAPVPLPHRLAVSSITFAPDGKTVTTVSAAEARVFVWDSATGTLLREWQLPQNWLGGSAVAAGGKVLAAVDAFGQVALYDVATRKQTHRLKGARGSVTLAPDGKSLAAGSGSGFGVWDVATGKQRCQLSGSTRSLGGQPTFSLNGTLIAVAQPDGSVGVWDARTGKAVQAFAGAANDLRMLAFTPNNKSLATCDGSGVVRTWELGSGRAGRQVQLPGGHTLNTGFFLPDGRTLLTAGMDGTVRLWEMASGRERHAFPGRGSSILSAAVTADGQALVMVGADNVALVREVGSHTASAGALTVAPSLPIKSRWISLRHTASAGALTVAPPPKDLEAAWADLAATDAARGYRAVTMLAGKRAQAVAFLKERLRPAAASDARAVAALVRDLNSPAFRIRQKAQKRLEGLPEGAGEALAAVLRGNPPTEVRRQIERTLRRMQHEGLPPEQLRGVRAVEVLEKIGTAEARQVIQRLAHGEARDVLTEEARAALERLGKAGPQPR